METYFPWSFLISLGKRLGYLSICQSNLIELEKEEPVKDMTERKSLLNRRKDQNAVIRSDSYFLKETTVT